MRWVTCSHWRVPRSRRHTPSPGGTDDAPAANSAAGTTHPVVVLGVGRPVRVVGARDERIAVIAGHQRGRVTRDQLRAAGISDDAIDRCIVRGQLRRVHRAVYAVGHTAPAPLADETAALLACGPHAVLSHQTAARLWKLLPDGDARIHVTIRGRHGARPTGVTVHRTRRLNRSEVRTVERLPITSALRTLLDLAANVDLRTLERAVEQALAREAREPAPAPAGGSGRQRQQRRVKAPRAP